MGVEHDPPWLAIEARQAHGQRRIVGERGLDADHDRLVGRPHDLDPEIGDLPGNVQPRIVRPARGEAVRRLGELQGHARPAFGDPKDVAAMVAPRLRRARADRHRNSRRPQPGVASARHLGVRVLDAPRRPGRPGLDDRVGAGRRFADMRAGLERHVEGRAARRLARLGDGERLGVRPSAGRGRRRGRRPRRPSPGWRRRRGWARRARATARRD